MNRLLLILLSLYLFTNIVFADTIKYNQYGQKQGSYKQTSSGYNLYNKYGSKTGSYKKTSTGYNSYDKYGQKTGSYKKNIFWL